MKIKNLKILTVTSFVLVVSCFAQCLATSEGELFDAAGRFSDYAFTREQAVLVHRELINKPSLDVDAETVQEFLCNNGLFNVGAVQSTIMLSLAFGN